MLFGKVSGDKLEFPLDVLRKVDDVSFEWVAGATDLHTAVRAATEFGRRSPGEYVVFDRRTQRVIARFNAALE